jgi:TolB-like protein
MTKRTPGAGPVSEPDELSPERVCLIRKHLDEVLTSKVFEGSKRAQEFLQLVVEHALAGRFDHLRERMIGAEMFGRPIDYDTANDAVVRVKATEIRKKLAQFYQELNETPAVRIELPPGSYVPKFHWKSLESVQPQAKVYPQAAAEPVAIHTDSGKLIQERSLSSGTTLRRTFVVSACLLLAVGLVGVIGYGGFKRFSRSSSLEPETHSIAILPLENLSGDPRQEYFADAMTEELIADLGQVAALRVISRTSAMTYKNTKKTLPEIARELGVDTVVEGSVVRADNRVRITAQLIDARTDRHLWAQSYVRDMTNVLVLQGQVAQAIADQIRIEVTPQEQARLSRIRTLDPEAQELYLQGMQRLNAGDPGKAIGVFQKAIDQDPNYAQAHAALADSYRWMGDAGWMPYSLAFPQEKAEALKAIQLDDALPDGHLALADAAMNLNWDWAIREKELKRALELNPNSASVHMAYSNHLERMGRIPEAIAESNLALQLDPVSSRAYMMSAFCYYFARQYDQALAQMQRASELPHVPAELQFPLGVIYVEKGMYEEAIQQFQGLGGAPHALGHMGNAYARESRPAEARRMISELEKHISKEGIGRYEIALIYAGLGDKDGAFAWLEKAYGARDKGLTFLGMDPCVDPLRSDPRFHDLVRRVGLPL